MAVTVNISQDILGWVINQTKNMLLPDKIINYLNEWIKGEKKPTYNQIESTSKATGIPFGYFFLKTPPKEDLSFVEYRTIDSVQLDNPSRNLIDTMHDMRTIQDWCRDYLEEEGVSKVSYVGAMQSESDIKKFSEYLRRVIGLQENWNREVKTSSDAYKVIRNKISASGTLVMQNGIVENNTKRKLDVNEFRAFALVDAYAPLIFINNQDSANGKLFSLLHEFAHILLGKNSLYNAQYGNAAKVKKSEVICNGVAAEILVPDDEFLNEWNFYKTQTDNKERVKTISNHFLCSNTVVARKALDHKFISKYEYNNILNDDRKCFSNIIQKQNGGGDYYRNAVSKLDGNFLNMINSSVLEGTTSYTDAYRLTNTNRQTFEKLIEANESRLYE